MLKKNKKEILLWGVGAGLGAIGLLADIQPDG